MLGKVDNKGIGKRCWGRLIIKGLETMLGKVDNKDFGNDVGKG